MSALGQKRTSGRASGMSALPPRADIWLGAQNVRLVPKADIDGLSRRGEVKSPHPWFRDKLPEGDIFATLLDS